MSLTLGSLHDKINKNPCLTKFEKDTLIEGIRKDFSRGGAQIVPGYLEVFLPLIKAQDGKTKLSDECLEQIIFHIREKKNDFWLRLVITVLFTGEPIEETMSLTSHLLGLVTREIRKKTPPLQLAWAETLIGLRFQPGPVPFNVWDIAPILLTNDIVATERVRGFLSRHFAVSERTVLRDYQSHFKDMARIAAETPGSIIERQDSQIGPRQFGKKPSDPAAGPDGKSARPNLEEKWGAILGKYFTRPREIFCQGDYRLSPLLNEFRGLALGIPPPPFQLKLPLEADGQEKEFQKRIREINLSTSPVKKPGHAQG